jgi:leucyl aminopeptidase
MRFSFAPDDADSRPFYLIDVAEAAEFAAGRSAADRAWLNAAGFAGRLGQFVLLPRGDGAPGAAVLGLGDAGARRRGRFHAARAVDLLPEGDWHIATDLAQGEAEEAALGLLLASYRFTRYKTGSAPKARFKAPKGIDAARVLTLAEGEALTRDLINTPASDMGPDELEAAMAALAAEWGASLTVTQGEALLSGGFPMIHAVGRASPRAPRLLDLRWGGEGPLLTLVGKGVCFDTGGLDIKPAASMGLMKKDMGGAATVMGLARSIMALGLRLRLRVLVPAVEINNTDAEGRIVLADALALADEEKPDLLISMATLTGAARVAVGPDLAPFYSDNDDDAAAIAAAGAKVADPAWRMPFWNPYEAMIEPGIADLDNAPSGGMAGSITAALFLRRFVTATPRYVHFDIYGWQPKAEPARPKGGVGQGARAILQALPELLGL